MSDYDDGEPGDDDEGQIARPRDRKIDEAKQVLMARYLSDGNAVFYKRQLEIWMEKEFFHWITARALTELGQDHEVGFNIEIAGTHKAHFYYPVRHRYPRRQIGQTIRDGLLPVTRRPCSARYIPPSRLVRAFMPQRRTRRPRSSLCW